MRATWLADVLTDAGLTIKPYPGWETRGRLDFEPLGIILHHTVTKASTSDDVVDRMLAVRGSSRVNPPLCNYSTNRDGTVSLIASGTANHGGVGQWNGRSGNRHWFGDEMKNDGKEPWPAVQLEAAHVAAAAILRHIGADESWVCGHKEYALPAGRKVDPHTLNMGEQRLAIAGMIRVLELEELMFKDVPADKYYAAAVEWMADNDISEGCNPPANDLFCPESPVKRGDLAVFLKRFHDRFVA